MLYQRVALRYLIPSSTIKCRRNPFINAPVTGQQLSMQSRRLKTSSSALSARESSGKVPTQVDKQTSLTWLQLHEHSPASYGVQAFDGYMELIPPKTPLPCKRSELMESALDYIRHASFGICCRRTIFDAPMEIAEDVVLDNIRLAKKGQAKIKVMMEMDKDLTGSVTVQDTWTKSKTTVDFDGGRLHQTRESDHHSLITSEHL